MHLSTIKKVLVVLAVGTLVSVGLFARLIANGGLTARQKPSRAEAFIAQRLVEFGMSREVRDRRNPQEASLNGPAVSAGRLLYRAKCEVCHGTDGVGPTLTGGGLYPPPRNLSRTALAQSKRTDGELFYLIRNGVRNTGMPAWNLPDEEIWELVSFIRNLPLTAPVKEAAPTETLSSEPHYVGSQACKACHAALYESWSKTPMANVVRDPQAYPEALIPDFSKPDPLLTFTVKDVALTYGSKWKQRYFKKVGDDYFVLPAQWDVTHAKWKPYFVKDDWWAPLYPPDNFQRPTGPLCDGCHSVNYNIQDKTVTEWNVGCERCHGPGSEHVKRASNANIVNPGRLGYVAANDVCIQCHSQGRPAKNPMGGRYYDWPVGYDVTRKLSDFWSLEEHKLGETTFTHFADGTAHKNRMQGNDFVQSAMYTHGVTCSTCHDVHGTQFASNLRQPAETLCLDCHGPGSPNGPQAPTLTEHTHHREGSPGSACISCHMPKIAQTLGDVNVRSHTFHFVTPSRSAALKIPNACNVCHSDKSTAWASEVLKSWSDRSPWRMQQ